MRHPIVLLCLLLLLLAGCEDRTPVTIHPERDSAGKPIAIPVTVVGTSVPTADGTVEHVPVYPVSAQAPKPPPPARDWVGLAIQIGLGVLGVGGTGATVAAVRKVRRARRALSMTAGLVDEVAACDDDAAVAKVKAKAAAEQERAGVRADIQAARGKRA